MHVPQETLDELIREVVEGFLALELEGVPDGEPPPRQTTATVQITGSVRLSVVVTMPPELGREFAGAMFGEDPEALSANEVDDALGEVANVLAGMLQQQFDGPTGLTTPLVVTGSEYELRHTGSELVSISHLGCLGLPFQVSLFEKTNVAQSEGHTGPQAAQPKEALA